LRTIKETVVDHGKQQGWSGVFPYLPTPMRPNGEPGTLVLAQLVENVISAGVHGITPLGSSGEGPYLDDRARAAVIETAVTTAKGRVPVVPGVSGFSVQQALRQARQALTLGADGILCMPLAFFPMTDAEIVAYVGSIADAIDRPVVVYHNPALCKVRMSTAVVERLASEYGVRYVKDASGDLANIARWREVGMHVFSSTAVSPTAAMLLGASGWMSGPASAYPAQSVAIYDLSVSGEWRLAAAVEHALEPALELFRTLGPGRGLKAILAAQGVEVGDSVPPVARLTEGDMQRAHACHMEVERRSALLRK
jgi:4-hydroxy-tetrahydrodipicolinate synthase